jgi:oligopeptide/dipeptide ABC transporter ATP-binding protein
VTASGHIEPSSKSLLSIDRLSVNFHTFEGKVSVLDEISLAIASGESVGIVGETGCGKSVLAKSVLGLLPSRTARYAGGGILWKGENLLRAPQRRLRRIRGAEIGMVFQDPMTFLDPLYTAGSYLLEAIVHRDEVNGRTSASHDRRGEAIALLGRLGLADPERIFDSYPGQLSGGMRQRILIAAAIVGRPRLLIADEPTTALDVTVQAQILHMISDLLTGDEMSLMLISHDLGVIASMCQRIVVMYAGTIVESGSKAAVLANPVHPYTRGLINAVPRLGYPQRTIKGIPGQIPNLLKPPQGCRFAARCALADSRCRTEAPTLERRGVSHEVACFHAEHADA